MIDIADVAEIAQFRELIAKRLGLRYEDGRPEILVDVLRQRMAVSKCQTFDAYAARCASLEAGADELRALAEQLTVGETFFFRNLENFRAFTERVLPERIRLRQRERQLRILSVGCASGEEPYSLAMSVRDAAGIESWDVRIRALDVNPSVLKKAVQGRYSAWSLRATAEGTKQRYFRADGRDFILDPAIKRMVSFEERNIVEEDRSFWIANQYDVIFCRNVIMYFTPGAMRDVVRRLHDALLPGGFLFLGHAETLRGLSREFNLQHTHGTFYYQRRSGARESGGAFPMRTPLRDVVADELPAAVDTTTSWVDAIRQASERIASLTSRRSAGTANVSRSGVRRDSTAPPSWNLALVLEAMRQERFADALALLPTLPPNAPGEVDALLLRAALLTNSGRLDEAEAVCTRLLAIDELNAGAHYLMALCREHAGDSANATEHDRTAIYLDADFAMPHLHLGLAARRVGDLVTAQTELERALTLLGREESSRLLLFGGGFSREALLQLCRAELRAVAGRVRE